MPFVIAEACIDEKNMLCVDECPVDCIYEGGRMLYIQPDECIDCGACEPACPVDAIYWEDDLPESLAHFTQVNAEFFSDQVTGWNSPRSAGKTGPTQHDHPIVAAHPSVATDANTNE